jgi:hypothetical protein
VTTKTEAASEVRKILQSVKDRMSQPGGVKVNEATTRAHFITPLLGALGYRSIDDILFEVYLPDGKTFLDYRLVVDAKPRVSVEAKALESHLTDKDAAQVVQYANLLGDQWSVVTNAREWRLYETFAQVPLAEKHIITIDLVGWGTDAEFDSVFERLWLTSREAFETSGGPATWLTTKKLDSLLRTALTDPGSPEIKYIRKRLQDQGVEATQDQLAAWLKARLDTKETAIPSSTPYAIGPPSVAHKSSESPQIDGYPKVPAGAGTRCWLIPAGRRNGIEAIDYLKMWLGRGYWALGERTPGRKAIQPGDRVCFYASRLNQIVAYADVLGKIDTPVSLDEWPEPDPQSAVLYKLPLAGVTWLQPPTQLDLALRTTLDAFKGKKPAGNWSFLVQTTRRVSPDDFKRLVGASDEALRRSPEPGPR